ncbi:hypothetical protein [Streptomyces litchfieldiae]|uniref:Uncharacterized protein n=1 Tax=Streptomyces litchfieldiae TaxID=3075543 RepID=A0ABU2MK79_9ACTN|nr:hypothetical protein [Streptomyces sp. DSM 44938]MDT0342020.1 hypothetical protein [Streptomyces sp. DSM 44938]
MAHNPHAPQPPQGPQDHDPAGSTQMFRAFVNDDAATRQATPGTPAPGPRVGLIVGVVVAIVVLAVVAWLALG